MSHPVTGPQETIDTLLKGPDHTLWTTSLTNEWARCARGLSASRSPERHIVSNQTILFI